MFDRSADTDSSIDTDALLCINMDEKQCRRAENSRRSILNRFLPQNVVRRQRQAQVGGAA